MAQNVDLIPNNSSLEQKNHVIGFDKCRRNHKISEIEKYFGVFLKISLDLVRFRAECTAKIENPKECGQLSNNSERYFSRLKKKITDGKKNTYPTPKI